MSKGADANDNRISILLVLLLFVVCAAKLQPVVLRFYFQHRIAIAAVMSFLVAVALVTTKAWLEAKRKARRAKKELLRAAPNEDAIFAGFSASGERVDIRHAYRRMHAQVIGTTNAGKTESVIIPWAVDDMKRGRGLILIDGKSDRSLLDKLYAYAVRHGRADDLRVLSLCSPEISHTFNPLAGGEPLEITERIFKALTFESEYYKDLQYEALLHSLLILEGCAILPTPLRVVEMLRSAAQMKDLALKSGSKQLIDWTTEFLRLSRDEREKRTSGLISKFQVFTVGSTATIFNHDDSHINLDTALARGHIVYCQLPVLKIPTLGKTTGKLILQALQGAIATRHLTSGGQHDYFSVYLDDFTEYLTEGFVSTLNKSRSAHILVTFAHQALGDLAILGDDIKNTILTNANLKVFMRTNEPTSAEYFSEVIGTSQGQKVTERQTSGAFGASKTGEGSVRDVEEFKFHPNVFKQDLGTGEGVLVVPHGSGATPIRVKFRMLPDVSAPVIPLVPKSQPIGLPVFENNQTQTSSSVISAILDEQKEAA